MAKITPRDARIRRHKRVTSRVQGSSERPRLSVFRSLTHIYAQVIDDTAGVTLASASTLLPDAKSAGEGKNKSDQAKVVGALVAKQALSKGISEVVFDRGGYQYHGRVKALAEGAREGGLKV